jgi:hypothetical protein
MSVTPPRPPRRLTAVAATVALVAGSVLLGVAPAHAVSCSGDACSGVDPQSSGCASGAYTATSTSFSGGLLEVRYSPTCKTNWSRLTLYSPGFATCSPHGQLLAVQDTGYQQGVYVPGICYSSPTTSWWTPMIYSPVRKVQGRFLEISTPWA